LLIALVFTLAAGIGAVIVVHLLIFLQARGVEFAAAVTIGTLFVRRKSARVVERLFGQHYHPIWTMIAACVLMAVGLFLIGSGISVVVIAVIIYGAGYGISWIARGTLAARAVRRRALSAIDGAFGVSKLDRAGAGAVGGAWLIERRGAEVAITALASPCSMWFHRRAMGRAAVSN
jgi:hypothetical protein